MDVAQTSQLIQLILNTVLLVNACGLLLAGLLPRQSAAYNRVRTFAREYAESLEAPAGTRSDRSLQLKKQLRQLQSQHRAAHNSVLAVHCALLFLVVSTFLLAARTVTSLSWLIPGSLLLFATGAGMLLLGLGLTLVDLCMEERSLWQDLKDLLSGNKGPGELRQQLRWRRTRSSELSQPASPTRTQPRSRARVS